MKHIVGILLYLMNIYNNVMFVVNDKKCDRIGSKGYGINAEFILYVSALETNRCEPIDTLATASFCQLEPDR